MKVTATIPRKKGNHSQGSADRIDRHKAYLTLKPIMWDSDVDTLIKQKAPNVKQGQQQGFEKQLYQLRGTEPPEKYILWKIDFMKKIVLRKPNYAVIFSALTDLTSKEAAMVLNDVYEELNISETDDVPITYTELNPDYGPFRDKATQKELLKVASDATTNVPMNDVDGEAAWQAFIKNPAKIGPLFLSEILFRLEELIFGTDMIGRNAHQLLRKVIRKYAVDPNRGIAEWHIRVNQLNGYIEHVPHEALENRNVPCEKYGEYEMREVLDYALPRTHIDKLVNIDWNIYENPYKKTIDKLVAFEPEIQADRAKEKESRELKDTVYGTKGTKRKATETRATNGKTSKTPCKTCSKIHKGECWFKNGGGGGNAGRNRGSGNNSAFNKQQLKIVSKMIKSSRKDDSDSESDATEGWKKNVSLVHQMYIAQQFKRDNSIDSDYDDFELNKDEVKFYLKKARKAEKSLKRS